MSELINVPKTAKSVAIIGGGAFGTALAKGMAEKKLDVTIWCYEQETADEINQKHTNHRFLPDIILPDNLVACSHLIECAEGKDIILLVTPSSALLATARQLINVTSVAEGKSIIACATKGFLTGSDGEPKLILDALENYLPGFYKGNLVYISGPSHAEELGQGKVTSLVAASLNPKNSIIVREALKSYTLRVFSSLDVTGVQVCAAIKNVIAIAFGAMVAYGESSNLIGDNAESFLLAGGLNEMMQLARAMGATHWETFAGPAGVGDLDVTCRSVYGRNRRFGRAIVTDVILKDFSDLDSLIKGVTTTVGYLPEGVFAARSAYKLAQKYNLKVPMFQTVYRVLNKEIPIEDGIVSLIFS